MSPINELHVTEEKWTLAGIRNFRPAEFDSPDAPGSGVSMDLSFVRILDAIRNDVGFPMPVDSGYRTANHNSQVGGVDASAHEAGVAADIGIWHRWPGIVTMRRYLLVKSAIAHGILRIGIGKSFVHLDMSKDLPQPRVWLYD